MPFRVVEEHPTELFFEGQFIQNDEIDPGLTLHAFDIAPCDQLRVSKGHHGTLPAARAWSKTKGRKRKP